MTATTNGRRTLSDHDHRMIAHAKQRRTVAVDRHDGRTTPATLIAWHPGSHPNTRVEFVNGSRATVPGADVRVESAITPAMIAGTHETDAS